MESSEKEYSNSDYSIFIYLRNNKDLENFNKVRPQLDKIGVLYTAYAGIIPLISVDIDVDTFVNIYCNKNDDKSLMKYDEMAYIISGYNFQCYKDKYAQYTFGDDYNVQKI